MLYSANVIGNNNWGITEENTCVISHRLASFIA